MGKSTVFWLLKQIRRRIPALIIMTLANAGYSLLCVYFALGTKSVIDSAIGGNQGLFLQSCIYQGSIITGILLCLTVTRYLRDKLHADLEKDWKQKLLHGLIHGDYAAVSGYHSAELVNRLNHDVEKINNGLLTVIPDAVSMVTKLIAAVMVLGTLDARFSGVIMVLGILVVLATGMIRIRLKELNKRVSEQDGIVSGYIQETMEKLLLVQAMDVSDEVERRSDCLLNARYAVQRKRKKVSLFANTGVSLTAYGAGFAALVWCAHRMLLGQMSFGSLSAVIQLVNQLQTPFVGLSGVGPQYLAMMSSAERLQELEAIQGEPEPSRVDPAETYGGMDFLQAEDLSFSYDRETVLQEASVSVPKGAFCVITGPSGIGKSTLLKLLLGIFTPESGSLYLRCAEQKIALDRRTRRLFAYVPQGNMLFSGTLRENLTIVNPAATEEELQQALYAGGVDAFLRQLPQQLDTVLGENGAGLSEGQAQRIAIARAVLGGAPILLLDECTSALDAETEQTVLTRLRELPDRMCIAVTHRPAAVALCDWKLEVEAGKIRMVRIANEETRDSDPLSDGAE